MMELLPDGLTAYWTGGTVTALRILAIIVAAFTARIFATRLIRAFRIRIAARLEAPEQVKRAETLGRVFRYLASVIITLIGGVLVLAELGISITPILGAAGVVGLAVGFGAQSLVKDYFTGFFILLENQVTQGDVVEIAGKTGVVEDVTLRYVRLRNYDGHVHYVPNGLIDTVTNMSQGFAYAVIDIGVAYRENTDEALAAMQDVAEKMRAEEEWDARISEPVEMVGVESWGDSAVILRCRFKVRPLQQWSVRREYLARLKHRFDELGIEIPFPHMTIYAGVDKQGEAPAFHVKGDAKQPALTPPG